MTRITEIHSSASPESVRLSHCFSNFGVLGGHFRTTIQLFAIPHNYEKRYKKERLSSNGLTTGD
jgi:hypothetical protein